MNIVLVEPEIPPNTGNIARLCAGTGSTLHLVRPLGFDIDEKAVRRAGLDYWDKVNVVEWESLQEFLDNNDQLKMYYVTTKAKQKYSDVKYNGDEFLLFGKETKGLPEELIFNNLERAITIPMKPNSTRSLNLATSVGIVLFETLRQNDFAF